MPTIDDYIKKLNEIKLRSYEEYKKQMEYYRTNYPEFYQKLIIAMKEGSRVESSTKFKMFLSEYKWYLIAIGVGIGVIIYLLYLLLR